MIAVPLLLAALASQHQGKHRPTRALLHGKSRSEVTMVPTHISRFVFAGLVGLMCAGTPAQAFDPARGARESIIQSVRDDVRRRIQAREREQRFRHSRAEYRYRFGEAPRQTTRIRKNTARIP